MEMNLTSPLVGTFARRSEEHLFLPLMGSVPLVNHLLTKIILNMYVTVS